jgi:hypothetical protein
VVRGRPILGHVPLFRRDPLALLAEAASEGDLVPLRLPQMVYLLNDPHEVHAILGPRSARYRKGHMNQRLRVLLGEGLITSEGVYWKRQRKLIVFWDEPCRLARGYSSRRISSIGMLGTGLNPRCFIPSGSCRAGTG